jgi:hypothetical protein
MTLAPLACYVASPNLDGNNATLLSDLHINFICQGMQLQHSEYISVCTCSMSSGTVLADQTYNWQRVTAVQCCFEAYIAEL